jgi:CHAP domain
MKDSKETVSNISTNKFLIKLKNWTVLSVTLPALLVPLLAIGTSSIGKAEEFKPRQLIAQSCRNVNIRVNNGQSKTFRRGASGTVCGYKFNFQRDGNLVLTNRSGQVLWATGTEGRGEILRLQPDGNLVIYGGGRALWATNTDGNPGAFLAIQSDGNLVMYRSDGQQALWASNTGGGGQTTASQPSQRESKRKVDAFASEWLGKTQITRWENYLPGQCVTLVARYLQDHYGASKNSLGLNNGGQTAATVPQISNSFSSINNTDDPIPGSIISFPNAKYSGNCNGRLCGHVALVVSSARNGNNLEVTILDSNWDGQALNGNSIVDKRSMTIYNPPGTSSASSSNRAYGSSISWVNPKD